MTLSDDKFPSSAIFDTIKSAVDGDEQLKQKSIKQSKALVVFELKNKQGTVESWYLDMKKTGQVGKGKPSEKPDVTLKLSDDHFQQLVNGKANAQKLFMTGKLKITGNVVKATAVQNVLEASRSKAKL